jgi:hypothetical protein
MPSLDEIREVICKSKGEDWHVIVAGGITFLDHFVLDPGGDDEPPELAVDSHTTRAVWKPDTRLGIASGLDYSGGELDGYAWAQKLPFDKTVKGEWVDVLWNGQMVDRQLMLRADDGNVRLPAPVPVFYPDDELRSGGVIVGESIPRWSYHLARIVCSFDGHDIDASIKSVGLVVPPER